MEPSEFSYPEKNDNEAPNALERFRRHVLETPAILDRLCEQTDTDSFVLLLVKLGGEHHDHFTADEVRAMLKTRRSEWLHQFML